MSIGQLIWLFICIIMCIIIIIYSNKQFKLYQKNILENGHKVRAEVLGYLIGFRRRSIYIYTLLKFKDIEGKEHIVLDDSQDNSCFNFKKGDIISIKYLEEENKLSSNKIYNLNILRSNSYKNDITVDLYNEDSEVVEKINQTDIDKGFSILILDKPTIEKIYKIKHKPYEIILSIINIIMVLMAVIFSNKINEIVWIIIFSVVLILDYIYIFSKK